MGYRSWMGLLLRQDHVYGLFIHPDAEDRRPLLLLGRTARTAEYRPHGELYAYPVPLHCLTACAVRGHIRAACRDPGPADPPMARLYCWRAPADNGTLGLQA